MLLRSQEISSLMKPGKIKKKHQSPSDSHSLGRCPWSHACQDFHKTWDSFFECITIEFQQVFCYDASENLKSYIMSMLKKPNWVKMEQLNRFFETLPYLHYSPKANQATKKVLPIDDANLETHLLRMCLASSRSNTI